MAETLSRDVALNVVGKIAAYQKELEKLPGFTQKMAAKSAAAMQKTFTKDIVDQLKKAEKEAEKSGAAWEGIFEEVGETISVELIKGVASAVAGAKSEIADLTGEISTYSRATGISVETVNALRFAMEAQGRTFDELGSVLENYPERLEQFRTGGGEAAGVMETLGFSTKNADKIIQDAGGTFEEILRRIQAIENPTQRAGLLTSMFGDSALYLATSLGDVPLEEWKDRAKIGIDVSERAVAANADWTSTVGILSEAFLRLKQDATSLIDVNTMAKDVGQAFVVVGTTMIGVVDKTIQGLSALATTLRMLAKGDFKSAAEAEAEFTAGGLFGIEVLRKSWQEGKQAGKEFRSVADSIGNMAAEGADANRTLGKTTQELKDAAAAAKQLEAELARQRKAQFDWYKTYRDITGDQTSEEQKLLQAHRDRQREAFLLVKEATISRGEYANYVELSEERLGRDIANLHKEQAKEAEAFHREITELLDARHKEDLEKEREYRQQIAEIGFEFANIVSSTFAGVFDLMSQARVKDLEKARKANEKHKDLIDDLLQKRQEATTKAEVAEIDSAIRIARQQSQSYADGVKSAKQAARDVAVMQKAQGLFQIGINTAQATMLAWATVPPPLNVAAAIAAGVAGAAQMAIAAAQPMPTFFGGTGRIPGGSPGEVQVTAHGGEAMLNARAASSLGPAIIDALNAGLSPLAAFAGGGGGGDIYLDGMKVGRMLDRSQRLNNRKATGFHSPYGRN